jgi:hypothetical protein
MEADVIRELVNQGFKVSPCATNPTTILVRSKAYGRFRYRRISRMAICGNGRCGKQRQEAQGYDFFHCLLHLVTGTQLQYGGQRAPRLFA